MGLYPMLDETETDTLPDTQSHRLQLVSEIEHHLKKEKEIKLSLYKKYHRGKNACDGVRTTIPAVVLVLGASGIPPLYSYCGACRGPFRSGSRHLRLAAVISKFIALRANAKKHNEILVLAESKLNTISDHISKAMKDDNISAEEFRLILSEANKYDQEKERIRQKTRAGTSDKEKNLWIQQGREEAILLLQRNAQRPPTISCRCRLSSLYLQVTTVKVLIGHDISIQKTRLSPYIM